MVFVNSMTWSWFGESAAQVSESGLVASMNDSYMLNICLKESVMLALSSRMAAVGRLFYDAKEPSK